jgi:predicted transcriptional regulator
MRNFYIKKLIVTGKGKTPSIVDLGEGLNIVCGPSDTGKSYIIECIDYIFGGDTVPIDGNTGYDTVKMIVETKFGSITAERVFASKKLKVSSTDKRVESGDYGTKTGKLNANADLWLKLIGVEERHTVIWKRTFEKKNLTWRFFLHMFLIKEERVIQRPSILLPRQNTAATGALSSLLYLITGKDFAETDPREEKKIRVAKKAAVAEYINGRLANFAERKVELDEMIFERIDLAAQVEEIIDEIARTEARIVDVTRRNKNLLSEIFTLNERLTECNTLLSRYQHLKSQYNSDVKRLSLIAVGDHYGDKYPLSAKCPFCDSDIQVDERASYIEPVHGALHKIQAQMRDLAVSDDDLTAERAEIESRIAELTAEKREAESLLNNELKPKAASLKYTLAEYRKAMEVQDEYHFISGLETAMKGELFAAQMEDE